MKRYLVWIGTRPEAIKLCPLILEMRRRGMQVRVMLSGQHRDMVSPVLSFFGVSADGDLSLMREGQGVQELTGRLLCHMAKALSTDRPDTVVVHGDTSTALCGAMTAFFAGIPVYHVEAGLRSDDIHAPFPEEFHRRAVDAMSDLHFAPTDASVRRLVQEGYRREQVFMVGNTATDALRLCLERPIRHPLLEWAGDQRRLILLTSHRRELGQEERRNLLHGVRKVIEARRDVCVIFPAHPSPAVRAAAQALEGCTNVIVTDPLPLPLMQHLLARSYLLLTDSGGLQEEATYLGIPTLVLRNVTERPEGIESGVLRTVGWQRESVCEHLTRLLDHADERETMARPSNAFGDGYAAQYIADVLAREERAECPG
jgi:UDP-N-acetylglucosamine 2-epimerase (non-hydrolysing)